ncbi:MAG: hypothetical protein SGILL_005056 [Bacillariaceae sp.]
MQVFTEEERVLVANSDDQAFNHNTDEAQAFKKICQAVNNAYGKRLLFGDRPQRIGLPFRCEERIVEWEIQAYDNDAGKLTEMLGAQQYHCVLCVTLRKLRTKRMTAGGFRKISKPGAAVDENDPMDDDGEEE